MSRTAIKMLTISSGLLIVVSIAFVVLAFQIISKEQQLNEQVALLATHQAQQDTFFELQKIATESEIAREELNALYFTRSSESVDFRSESVDFLNEVEALAPVLGITIETESLQEIESEGVVDWIEMSFSASGPQADIERFVALLENSPYALRTTALTLEERSSALWALTITVQVKLLAYES